MSKDESGSGKPRRLGRGLSALVQTSVPIDPSPRSPGGRLTGRSSGGLEISQTEVKPIASGRSEGESSASEFQWLAISSIVASPFQPRTSFDPDAIRTLGESIKRSGMMQPLVVRPVTGDGRSPSYELVAGERRWRAAREAGLERAPAIVRTLSDKEAAELALVENLQRRDLNAIERGFAFRRLREQFGLSQEQIGELVGLERSSVSNIVRLTELEEEIRGLIASEKLGSGHGKALLGIAPGQERIELAHRACEQGWSVRRLEQETSPKPGGDKGLENKGQSKKRSGLSPALADMERQLSNHLGTRVRLKADASGVRGSMVIEFYDLDQFDGLLGRLGYTAPLV